MKIRKRNKTWIYVVAGLLLVAMVGGILYATLGNTSDKVKTKTISASEFSLGGLDENGKYVETKESIYTKDAFQCQGLTVVPEFESQVTYQIFFYDELGNFVSKTDVLEKSFSEDIDIFTTHARIVITPNVDENGDAVTLNVFKVSKYAKQLTIKVNKEQKVKATSYTLDLSGVQLIKGIVSTGSADSLLKLRANDETTQSYLIELDTYKKYFDGVTLVNPNGETLWFCFLTEEPILGNEVSLSLGHSQETSSEKSVELHIPSDAKYLCVRYAVSGTVCAPSSIVFSKI